MVYPAELSVYKKYAEWNQDKKGNMRLVRNTPDFQMALALLEGKASVESQRSEFKQAAPIWIKTQNPVMKDVLSITISKGIDKCIREIEVLNQEGQVCASIPILKNTSMQKWSGRNSRECHCPRECISSGYVYVYVLAILNRKLKYSKLTNLKN